MSSTKRQSPEEREATLAKLREWMPEGSTVYCVLRSKSRSGMQRVIGLVTILRDKGGRGGIDLRHQNYAAAEALGARLNDRENGIIVRGAGMDMGWHLVRRLSRALYGREDALRANWI